VADKGKRDEDFLARMRKLNREIKKTPKKAKKKDPPPPPKKKQ
jgi:hypothetical protein